MRITMCVVVIIPFRINRDSLKYNKTQTSKTQCIALRLRAVFYRKSTLLLKISIPFHDNQGCQYTKKNTVKRKLMYVKVLCHY